MRSFLLLWMFLMLTCPLQAQKGIINKGSLIVVSGNAVISAQGSGASYINQSAGAVSGRLSLDGKIYLQGDWLNNADGGTVLLNPSNDGEVIFQGNSAQTIGGNLPTGFGKISVNNSQGIFLSNHISVAGDLVLGTGSIYLSDYHLTLGPMSVVAGGPSEMAMVITDGAGELRKKFDAPAGFVFPVGDNTDVQEYAPVSVLFPSGTFAADAFASVRVFNTRHPMNSSSVNYLNRYWSMSQSGINDFLAELKFYYTPADVQGDEMVLFGGQYTAPLWTKLSAVNTAEHSFSATTNVLSEFTAGESSAFESTLVAEGKFHVRMYTWRSNLIIAADNPEVLGPFVGIYNLSGQMVQSCALQKEKINQIQTFLPAGIYIVKMAGRDKVYTAKLYIPGH